MFIIHAACELIVLPYDEAYSHKILIVILFLNSKCLMSQVPKETCVCMLNNYVVLYGQTSKIRAKYTDIRIPRTTYYIHKYCVPKRGAQP